MRQALREEFARIEQAMEEELPVLGRGVAFFACRPLGLWRQIAVPLPLPDGYIKGCAPMSDRSCARGTSMTASSSHCCRSS